MTTTALSNTVYTQPVAKVMISIPDGLLERLDVRAKANRETRSGFLRRLVEEEIAADNLSRRKELEDLLGPPVNMGGDAARLIRQDRESH
jgi:HicB_like antitoxin of bacterial toxin-antitoxin system